MKETDILTESNPNTASPHPFLLEVLSEIKVETTEQLYFIKELEKVIINTALAEGKASSVFLYKTSRQFKTLFPGLRKNDLDDLIASLDGIIIYLDHYRLSSLSMLAHHINRKKRKLGRSVFAQRPKKHLLK